MRPTFHLIPHEVWAASDPAAPLTRDSLADEGFIHCTDGADALIATANRHYRDDPRLFIALTVDLDAVTSPWRYDDPGTPYPHIYGPIDRGAIVDQTPVIRAADGTYLTLAGR
jgi:uncharacterized protein (DUF952 family)